MFLALIVAWIVFTILLKIVKTTVKTAFVVAALIVLLQTAYGITPLDMWNQVVQLPHTLSQIRGGK